MTRVAIQGIRGSYSEEAARRMMGPSVELIECADFASTFDELNSDAAVFAVVPLRNSIIGPIGAVTRLLRRPDMTVLEEFDLEIRHVLAGTPDALLTDIATVRSHP